ncbi:MAG: hypothetical protein LBO81_05685 [Clostridiales Family XIII bacterium]|jgi:hypothetical protein|nr:hypothetical protein [Clostridiales Family XIII bacterium]
MRNFLYNKSDLFVALAIIAVAALIIWTRIDAIMDFPTVSGTAEETPIPGENGAGTEGNEGGSTTGAEGNANENTTGTDATGAGTETTAPATGTEVIPPSEDSANAGDPRPPQQPATVSFVVEIGQSTSTIADNLLTANLIQSKEEFLTAVRSMGAESKLKAGIFNIQTDASLTDIIDILTKG